MLLFTLSLPAFPRLQIASLSYSSFPCLPLIISLHPYLLFFLPIILTLSSSIVLPLVSLILPSACQSLSFPLGPFYLFFQSLCLLFSTSRFFVFCSPPIFPSIPPNIIPSMRTLHLLFIPPSFLTSLHFQHSLFSLFFFFFTFLHPSIPPSIRQGDSCSKRLQPSIIPQSKKKTFMTFCPWWTQHWFSHMSPSHFVSLSLSHFLLSLSLPLRLSTSMSLCLSVSLTVSLSFSLGCSLSCRLVALHVFYCTSLTHAHRSFWPHYQIDCFAEIAKNLANMITVVSQ